MDMPIKIMMVLFVSLIVAWSMIQFSRSIIDDSKMKLDEVGNDPRLDSMKENVIELSPGTAKEIFYLAEECLKRGKGAMAEENLCFVVKFSGAINVGDISTAWTNAGYDVADLQVIALGGKAAFITYVPTDKVRIEI